MLFGEIVEPSTRALIDDELETYPDYLPTQLQWDGQFIEPNQINALIFIESRKVKSAFNKFLAEKHSPLASLRNGGVDIYQTDENIYLIMFTEQDHLPCGQIVEELAMWIRKSKQVFAVTSASISTYLNDSLAVKPVSLVKTLCTERSNTFGHTKLEPPNLVTGLGASVLTYCLHTGLQCSLFIFFVDASPLDSLNAAPLLQLFHQLNLPIKSLNLHVCSPSNNLYM